MTKDNVDGYGVALQGEAADRPAAEAARAQILSASAADLVAGMGEGFCEADRAAITEEGAEDLAANFREGLRVGADGWIDDDLASVRPWRFDVSEVAAPTTLWHGTEDRLVPVAHGQWLAARILGVVAHFRGGGRSCVDRREEYGPDATGVGGHLRRTALTFRRLGSG